MKLLSRLVAFAFLVTAVQAIASEYDLPPPNEALIGGVQYSTVEEQDTATKIAQRYDIGFNALQKSNPHLNFVHDFEVGNLLQIPTLHLLPNAPRQGIIVNLPEMRIYYFPAGTNLVYTYPIGIGKIGKTIPITRTSIVRKTKDPVWIPPEDIRDYNLEKGIVLPKVMPPGPDNPLGPYAIYMKIPTYLFHSTIFPESVGKRASFGCLRMYEQDIENLYPQVKRGIPVLIINEPVKVAWQNSRLYMEMSPPLEEHSEKQDVTIAGIATQVLELTKNKQTLVDWQIINYIADEQDGMPHEIGSRF